MSRRSLAVALFSLIALAVIGATHPSVFAAGDDAKPAAKKEPWKSEDFIFTEAPGIGVPVLESVILPVTEV